MLKSSPRSTRNRALALAAAFVMGAASLAAQAPNTRAMLPGYAGPILLDTLARMKPVTGHRDSIYVALFKTMAELEIPVEGQDRQAKIARNLNVQRMRRLGGAPLSKYYDCGRSFAGDNANLYRLTLALAAWVATGPDSLPRLYIATAAGGQDPAGSRSGYVMCNSTGGLEERIAQRVRQLLAGS